VTMQDRQSGLKCMHLPLFVQKQSFCLSLPLALFGKENHADLSMVL